MRWFYLAGSDKQEPFDGQDPRVGPPRGLVDKSPFLDTGRPSRFWFIVAAPGIANYLFEVEPEAHGYAVPNIDADSPPLPPLPGRYGRPDQENAKACANGGLWVCRWEAGARQPIGNTPASGV